MITARTSRTALNSSIGTDELCAWQPVPGVTWVQTRSPQFARKLSQRGDSRLVVRGVAGGYLRTFEFHHTLTWGRRLIARYTTRNEVTTNARITAPASQASLSEPEGSMLAAGNSDRCTGPAIARRPQTAALLL
jgi:hypothetical protein